MQPVCLYKEEGTHAVERPRGHTKSPWAWRRAAALCWPLDAGLSDPETVRAKACCFAPHVCSGLLWQTLQTSTHPPKKIEEDPHWSEKRTQLRELKKIFKILQRGSGRAECGNKSVTLRRRFLFFERGSRVKMIFNFPTIVSLWMVIALNVCWMSIFALESLMIRLRLRNQVVKGWEEAQWVRAFTM